MPARPDGILAMHLTQAHAAYRDAIIDGGVRIVETAGGNPAEHRAPAQPSLPTSKGMNEKGMSNSADEKLDVLVIGAGFLSDDGRF
jgi:hypothetical protein